MSGWELAHLRGRAEGVHHRWNLRQISDLLPDQELTQAIRIESRHQDNGTPGYQRRVEHHVQTIDMVKRQKTQDALSRTCCRLFPWGEILIHISEKIVVRKHHPFGQA